MVDGQVCNGGFGQFYHNTRGLPAPLGVEGLRSLDREDLASLVRESLKHAAHEHAHLLDESIRSLFPITDQHTRPFEELDREYFALSQPEGPNWLDKALTKFVLNRPELFC